MLNTRIPSAFSSLNPCSPPFIPAPRHLSTLKNSPRNPFAPSISSNHALSFCHLNSRSLINKIPEIKHFLHTNGIQLLAITETWLHPNIPDNLVQLEEFQPVFRRDRRTGQHGGGVCMLLSNDLPAKRRDDLEHPELEVLWVEICPSPIKFNGRIHQSRSVGRMLLSPSQLNQHFLSIPRVRPWQSSWDRHCSAWRLQCKAQRLVLRRRDKLPWLCSERFNGFL